MKAIRIIPTLILAMLAAAPLHSQSIKAQFKPMADSINTRLSGRATIGKVKIDTINVIRNRQLNVICSSSLSDYPLRDADIRMMYEVGKALMPSKFSKFEDQFKFYLPDGRLVDDLSDAFFSGRRNPNQHRQRSSVAPIVTDDSAPYEIESGLEGRNIALWQSHGYYYDQNLQRWQWQRARMFLTVEDLYTQSYVLPFLVPMLENAGAKVFLPRERDVNTNEVIVDNDDINKMGYSDFSGEMDWTTAKDSAFANPKLYYVTGENPFRMGTSRIARTVDESEKAGSFAYWRPTIPEDGDYAVYVSYVTGPKSTDAAHYTVMHAGGVTEFSVNQQIGDRMWVYLGTFTFRKGRSEDQGVMLSNIGKNERFTVSADAVKFGGGMGNIARKPSPSFVDRNGNKKSTQYDMQPEISHYPRFTEGSRYWLQWSGFSHDIYSPQNEMTDYTDDYQNRGIWVNALNNGSANNPKYKQPQMAKKIPIDLSFAFHTDAGFSLNDSIVGTLAIYTPFANDMKGTTYPDGSSKMTARDYCDIVQTQIVNDVKAQFEPNWNRRMLWQSNYAESRIAEVPAMLLELLSHENFADMRYGLDPNFRFTVSRAIYKGMLKYLSYRYGVKYVVAPLPVKSFYAQLTGENNVHLAWKAVDDPLEPTADASRYIVYTRVDDGGFDNGRVVSSPSADVAIVPGHIYSYKVEALNDGGKSFPSEILSVGVPKGKSKGTVLVVNCFDRVSAPASYATRDTSRAGFDFMTDNGVPYIRDISTIGEQHEYRRNVPWADDDAPGFGASYADLETKVIAGNTFDYPKVHGAAFLKKGYAFCSSSRDAVTEGNMHLREYRTVDFIFGKQVTTQIGRPGSNPLRYAVFPLELQSDIANYCLDGEGNVIVSGANIGTDIWDKDFDFPIDSVRTADIINPSKKFVQDVLHWRWMTNHASRGGAVKAEQTPAGFTGSYEFNTEFNDRQYCVEAPDGINPVGKHAVTVMRYDENEISAGVAYDGHDYRCVSFGFPIESLTSQEQIDKLLGQTMDFFAKPVK